MAAKKKTDSAPKRILLIGKFPPIQGGVSAQTHTTAFALARNGWIVDVVTNSGCVEGTFRQHLFDDDVDHLTRGVGVGAVLVHQAVQLRNDAYVPWAPPYSDQLFGVGARLLKEAEYARIVGWYLQPYGLAAAHLSTMSGIPLVLLHAGSDLGPLSDNPDLASAYSWALKKAKIILTSTFAQHTMQRLSGLGVDPGQLRNIQISALSSEFRKGGKVMDLQRVLSTSSKWFSDLPLPRDCVDAIQEMNQRNISRLDNVPVIGAYGKVGAVKGTGFLLDALDSLVNDGNSFRLQLMVGGRREPLEATYRRVLSSSLLRERTLVLPLVAPWRVPSFLKSCQVVCFLENRFPVALHMPRVPREILASGACLVTTREIADDQPFHESLAHGKNIVIVDDPSDIGLLAKQLSPLLKDPENTHIVGKHGEFLSRTCEQFFSQTDSVADGIEQFLGQ